jgi:hypothetical protein
MAMAMAMEQQPQQQQQEEEERFVTDLAILRISFTLFIRIYHPTPTTSPYSSLYSGISLFQPQPISLLIPWGLRHPHRYPGFRLSAQPATEGEERPGKTLGPERAKWRPQSAAAQPH